MVLDGCHFKLGNFDSREYGLIFAHCDTNEYIQLSGEIDSSYVFNRKNKVRYISYNSYDKSPISFEAEIMDCDELEITKEHRRVIEKGLFNKSNYQKLYIDAIDDYNGETIELIDGILKRSYLNCRFLNPSKIYDGADRVRGYRFTIECDSCMMWQDAITKKYTVASLGADPIAKVPVNTDIDGFTYPKVKIKVGSSGGDISFANITDDPTRITKFKGITPNITLIMNGDINYISGQNYDKFENQNFIRLVDGENSISINGDVESVEIEWSNRRFI